MTRGDDVFPAGYSPRSCTICGQYERGRGFRMGYAKAAHGRKHVREGTAREIACYGRWEYVLTDEGAKAADELLRAQRCAACGLAAPKHTRDCWVAIGIRLRNAR